MSKINVFFIRHGFSYANASHFGYTSEDYTKFMDSPLTHIGINYSENAGIRAFKKFTRKNIKLDSVYCSTMTRAIQTAHKMFPHEKIIPICHIKELDNENADKLTKYKQKLISLKSQFKDLNIDTTALKSKCKNSTDYNKFVQFLKKITVNSKKELNVAVVTHSMYMKKHLELDEIPYNNEIYKVTYKFDDKNSVYQSSASLFQVGMKNIPPKELKKII